MAVSAMTELPPIAMARATGESIAGSPSCMETMGAMQLTMTADRANEDSPALPFAGSKAVPSNCEHHNGDGGDGTSKHEVVHDWDSCHGYPTWPTGWRLQFIRSSGNLG